MNANSIYLITNKINNKKYVGQTWKKISYRWQEHSTKEKSCVKLNRAIKKYGKDNFSVELLAICSSQYIADYLESYYIQEYNSIKAGYNIREGGSHGKLSESTKSKISKALKGRTISPETIEKYRNRKQTQETKNKIGAKTKGQVLTDEHKNAITISNSNRIISEETKQKHSKNNKDKIVSEETKLKMSEAAKQRWINKKK